MKVVGRRTAVDAEPGGRYLTNSGGASLMSGPGKDGKRKGSWVTAAVIEEEEENVGMVFTVIWEWECHSVANTTTAAFDMGSVWF